MYNNPKQATHQKTPLLILLTLSIIFFLILLLTVLLISPLPSTFFSLLSTSTNCPSYPIHHHQVQQHQEHQQQKQQQQQQCPTEQYISRPFTENPDLERIDPEPGIAWRDWESILIPPTGGSILAAKPEPKPKPVVNSTENVDGSEYYDEEEEDEDITKRVYGISMYHQLHCLLVIRGLVFPETTHKAVNSTSKSHLHGLQNDRVHWAHCFDYLAQAIICAADDTIEEPKPLEEHQGRIYNIDGIDAVHQCRDARVLWEASTTTWKHPVNMSTWKGQGVRSLLGDTFRGEVNIHDMPVLYSTGLQDPS